MRISHLLPSDRLRDDFQFVLRAVQLDPIQYSGCSERLKGNRAIALAACCPDVGGHLHSMELNGGDLHDDEAFLLECLRRSPFSEHGFFMNVVMKYYVSARLRSDVAFVSKVLCLTSHEHLPQAFQDAIAQAAIEQFS